MACVVPDPNTQYILQALSIKPEKHSKMRMPTCCFQEEKDSKKNKYLHLINLPNTENKRDKKCSPPWKQKDLGWLAVTISPAFCTFFALCAIEDGTISKRIIWVIHLNLLTKDACIIWSIFLTPADKVRSTIIYDNDDRWDICTNSQTIEKWGAIDSC